MLVHVKTPRTEIEIKGNVSDQLLNVLRNEFGKSLEVSDDDTLVDPFEADWFKDTKTQMTPGDYLKIDRENAEITQAELGNKLGAFSRQYVSDLENNRKNISLNVAKKLAELFDRSIERYI